MARRTTPPEWQAMMDAAGISSLTRLAEKAGLSQTTVTRTVHRDHTPGDHTIATLAKTLRVPAKEIYKLTHGQEIQSRPWEPPAEVQRLTKREQDAVTEMIRAMAAGREEQGPADIAWHEVPIDTSGDKHRRGTEEVASDDDSTPTNQAAGSAAAEKHKPPHDEEQAREIIDLLEEIRSSRELRSSGASLWRIAATWQDDLLRALNARIHGYITGEDTDQAVLDARIGAHRHTGPAEGHPERVPDNELSARRKDALPDFEKLAANKAPQNDPRRHREQEWSDRGEEPQDGEDI